MNGDKNKINPISQETNFKMTVRNIFRIKTGLANIFLNKYILSKNMVCTIECVIWRKQFKQFMPYPKSIPILLKTECR